MASHTPSAFEWVTLSTRTDTSCVRQKCRESAHQNRFSALPVAAANGQWSPEMPKNTPIERETDRLHKCEH